MARGTSEEKKRVQRAVAYVLQKLSDNCTFIVQADEEEDSLLSIERSGRGAQDKNTFIVGFNPKTVSKISRNKLRQAVYHEWLHSASWELYDEIEALIERVKPSPLKKELYKRYLDIRENVVYHIERRTGPHVFPSIPYED